MQLGFIGFGLIAGSIAQAVRANPATADWPMAAWSPSGEGPRRAAAEGVMDVPANSPEDVLRGADLVILAGPATACLEDIDRLGGPWREHLAPDAVVTDVASTKAMLVARADAAGLRYVGGHPMAGREMAGYEGADADLFEDRPWVVVPGAHASVTDVERVAALASACRAHVVVMDAAAHDRAVAGISHLPLVVAAALVEAVAGGSHAVSATLEPAETAAHWPEATAPATGDWPEAAAPAPSDWPEAATPAPGDWAAAAPLAAGGWRDTTRVARGDPAMGAAIAVTNAPALADRLRDLRIVLDAWLAELERPGGADERAIAARLEAARAILEEPR